MHLFSSFLIAIAISESIHAILSTDARPKKLTSASSNEAKLLFCVSDDEFSTVKLSDSFNKTTFRDTIKVTHRNNTTDEREEREEKDRDSCGRGINYNINGNYIVWSNVSAIFAAPFDKKAKNALGIDSKRVLFTVTEVNRLSLDWIHHLLYYIDNGEIFVTNIYNVKNRLPLDTEGKMKYFASDIIVNPIESFIVWVQWDRKTFEFQIVKADQDGSNKKVIINKSFYGYDPYVQFRPCCLEIDYKSKLIYFVDNKFQTLESVTYDGSNRLKYLKSTLLSVTHSSDIFNNFAYWTNDKQNTVFSADRINPTGKINAFLRADRNIDSIRVIHPARQPNGENRCANSKCAFICLPAGSDQYKCLCSRERYNMFEDQCYESHNSVMRMSSVQISKKNTGGKSAKLSTVTITESLTKPYPLYTFKCQMASDKRMNQSIKLDWFSEEGLKFSEMFKKSPIMKNMTSGSSSIELRVSYPFVKQLKNFQCKSLAANNNNKLAQIQANYNVVVRQLPKNPTILSQSFAFAGTGGSKVYLTLQIENSRVEPPVDKYRLVYRGLLKDSFYQQEYYVEFDPMPSTSNNVIYVIPFDIDYVTTNTMAFTLYARNEVGWSQSFVH